MEKGCNIGYIYRVQQRAQEMEKRERERDTEMEKNKKGTYENNRDQRDKKQSA